MDLRQQILDRLGDGARLDLDDGVGGTLSLAPMRESIEPDYEAMAGMIMEAVPRFADVLDAVADLMRTS